MVRSFSQVKSASESCLIFTKKRSPIFPSMLKRCVCSISRSQDLLSLRLVVTKSLFSKTNAPFTEIFPLILSSTSVSPICVLMRLIPFPLPPAPEVFLVSFLIKFFLNSSYSLAFSARGLYQSTVTMAGICRSKSSQRW